MLALCCLYLVSLALTLLLLALYWRSPVSRFTANLALTELIMLAAQTILLAAVFLF